MSFEVNERIRKYRKEKRMTAKDLAKAIGMNYTTYCRMESKAKNISSDVIIAISQVLEINPDLIFYGENSLKFTPLEPKVIQAETPNKRSSPFDEPLPVLFYKSGDFEITPEEKDLIKLFRNLSEDGKQKIRDLIVKLK